jgi:uncharacterized membrane protein
MVNILIWKEFLISNFKFYKKILVITLMNLTIYIEFNILDL